MDYSLPGSSVHGIFQAKILEWVAIYFLLQGIKVQFHSHLTLTECIFMSLKVQNFKVKGICCIENNRGSEIYFSLATKAVLS